jgi:hypothetical protein
MIVVIDDRPLGTGVEETYQLTSALKLCWLLNDSVGQCYVKLIKG